MVQGSLFEEDYLVRTLGTLAQSPDYALTELVANAWDAGASRITLAIPDEHGQPLIVEDDGSGMTPEQFHERWMTLGYDRVKHQGNSAEFPPDRQSWNRRAFGRNGVGRHGLLCFANEYEVDTVRDGERGKYVVRTAAGQNPFVLSSEKVAAGRGHGTRLKAAVIRNLPNADRIRDVLSARFLHDPRFTVVVNGQSLQLWEHSGLIDRTTLDVDGNAVEAYFIDSMKASRSNQHQGVAIWVGGRLVGTPSWVLGFRAVIDGRTRLAKRHTVVVATDSYFDEVLPDWSGFKKNERTDRLFDVISEYVEEMFRRLSKDRIQDTTDTVLREHRADIEHLQPLARIEVADFVEKYTAKEPMVQQEALSAAVRAIIEMEKTRSGAALLEKIAKLSEEDIDGLNSLLDSWSVRDAATVLEEIDRRLIVAEALARFSADKKADELHTLHPLVTESRWLFGPEFDSPEYTANVSLTRAMREIFHKRSTETAFLNPRKRPDLLVLADSTVSSVATEQIDDNGLASMKQILLIELKRGDSEINRDNVNQACDYVEDLLGSGLIDGFPIIRAFVVGHRANDKVQLVRKIGENPEHRVCVTTFNQLVRTANQRLFKLKDQLSSRYDELKTPEIMRKVFSEPFQYPLAENVISVPVQPDSEGLSPLPSQTK